MKIKNSIAKLILWLVVFVTLFSATCVTAFATAPNPDPWAKAIDPNLNYLLIVNDDHPYDFTSAYDIFLQKDLVYAADIYGYATPVEKAAFLAFSQLQVALKEKGMTIGLYSAYRTKEDQQWVYDYYSNLPGWSETNKVVKPGYSEHHTGLLINVVILYPDENGNEIWYTETAERQQTIPFFKTLHENLADYGFIDRYPAGKEKVTGVPCEPYEIRFVGTSQTAHEIMDHGLCLEEYVYGQ